jgi:NAD(P)-dependent dehydrogenase (short-subunit alcohol dehydrogenase family)
MILKGKVVILSGTGPGMGVKLARIAVDEGAKVVLGARSADYLEDIAREIRESGGAAIAVPTDVTDPDACQRMADRAIDEFGRIDGLVNSAYINGSWDLFEDADLRDWRRGFDVTFWGALHMIKAVLPQMKRQNKGVVVNVSSQGTVRPQPARGDYACAKAALNGATRTLARELGKYNIRFITTRIGRMMGAPLEKYVADLAGKRGVSMEAIMDEFRAPIALGVIPPDEECARAVAMFLSDYASMMTGAAVDINGGETFS